MSQTGLMIRPEAVVVAALVTLVTTALVHRNVLWFKTSLYLRSTIYLLLSRDAQYKKVPATRGAGKPAQKIVLVFVRHGESTWNEVFNLAPKWMMPIRLVRGLWAEWTTLLLKRDSIFVDAPLNVEGVAQACTLDRGLLGLGPAAALSRGRWAPLLTGGRCPTSGRSSRLVCSNLRRACETVLWGFASRISSTGEKLEVLSSLQEVSRNIDTYSTCSRKNPVQPRELPGPLRSRGSDGVMVATSNTGNKTLKAKGGTRLTAFCHWAFRAQREDASLHMLIVGGHSLWMRSFFRMFLVESPGGASQKELVDTATTKKIYNGGVVLFELSRSDAGEMWVESKSIEELFLGFAR